MSAALETVGLSKQFGGLVATNNVSMRLERGARHALIGPNGAGKTTLINLLTGVLAPTSGRILLDGHDVTRLKPERRVKLGLVRTFQINQLFPALTPFEALMLAISETSGAGWVFWRGTASSRAALREIGELSERFRLGDVLQERTATLPYGKQRLLEIAIAFACRPRVLLLDEPAAGVLEADRQELLAAIAGLPPAVSVLLIEHDIDLVFRFASEVTVLADGAVLTHGPAKEVAADPRVRAVYLGEATIA